MANGTSSDLKARLPYALEPVPSYLTLYPPILPLCQDYVSMLSDNYILSTHIVPAAFPRTTTYVPYPTKSGDVDRGQDTEESKMESLIGTTKDAIDERKQRQEQASRLARYILNINTMQYQRGEKIQIDSDSNSDGFGLDERRVLWTVLSRYVRKSNSSYIKNTEGKKMPISLFLTHANGLTKEVWEPFLVHLTSSCNFPSSNITIEEIWTMDAVHHGDSALLNEGKLGALYDWIDHTRDIMNFLINYLPPLDTFAGEDEREFGSTAHTSYTTYLPFLPQSLSRSRIKSGICDRTMIAIGHSFGGCTVAHAAHHIPRVFSSLILVDPIIRKSWLPDEINWWIMNGVSRRDEWPSRDEARRNLQSSKVFSQWDPSVLDIYIERCLIPVDDRYPNGSVKLKTPKMQEAVVFSEERFPMDTYAIIPFISEQISIRWIMAGKDSSATGGEELTRQLVVQRPANSSNIRIKSSGHLIAQEAPRELALDIHSFLSREYLNDQDQMSPRRARL